jgi:hypothetical protein
MGILFHPQEESLAAVLGMAVVDPRYTATTVRMASDFPTVSNKPLTKKKTLFNAIVETIASSSTCGNQGTNNK